MSEQRKVRTMHLAIGVDLIGSKTSMAASKNIELTELEHGIQMHSKGSNRTVVIPWSNIKGYELEKVVVAEKVAAAVPEAKSKFKL